MTSKTSNVTLADTATMQHLLERYGPDAITAAVKQMSLQTEKKIYGYGYARVSDERTDPQSLGLQEQILRNYAEELGVTIIAVYSDHGVSGGLPAEKRPGFMKVLNEVKAGQKIIASRSDRLFRNSSEKRMIHDWLRDKNVTMHAKDYIPEDEFNKSSRLPNRIVDEVNEHLRHVTAEKVKAGLRLKSSEGTLRSRPHYGYVGNKVKGQPWVEVEYEQNVIKKIIELKTATPKLTNGQLIEGVIKAGYPFAKQERVGRDGAIRKPTLLSYQLVQTILTRAGLASVNKPAAPSIASNTGSVDLSPARPKITVEPPETPLVVPNFHEQQD